MQVKKDELRNDIYQAACQEFLLKGYESSSMRSIAKKANTSIGNIYNYYESKEAMIDEMIQSALKEANGLFQDHLSLELQVVTREELEDELNKIDKDQVFDAMGAIIRPEFVIFMKQKLPKYQIEKNQFMRMFQEHLAWHLTESDPNDYFVKMVVNLFVESISFMVKTNQRKEKTYDDFIRLFRMLFSGLK